MKIFLQEISYDLDFIKGHKLQPPWFKTVKLFILLAVIAGFVILFGWKRAVVFTIIFLLLMLIVHLVYRVNTRKFTRNWLDFVVVENPEKKLKPGIGAAYYASVVLNALVAFLLSGAIAG